MYSVSKAGGWGITCARVPGTDAAPAYDWRRSLSLDVRCKSRGPVHFEFIYKPATRLWLVGSLSKENFLVRVSANKRRRPGFLLFARLPPFSDIESAQSHARTEQKRALSEMTHHSKKEEHQAVKQYIIRHAKTAAFSKDKISFVPTESMIMSYTMKSSESSSCQLSDTFVLHLTSTAVKAWKKEQKEAFLELCKSNVFAKEQYEVRSKRDRHTGGATRHLAPN